MPEASPKFDDDATLVSAIVQDAATGQVLMLAHMNRAAWDQTVATGEAVYYSRSRGRLWKKGEQSGHVQRVRAISVDCDADAVLLKVDQDRAPLHEGYATCFFRKLDEGNWQIVEPRLVDPATVYSPPPPERLDPR